MNAILFWLQQAIPPDAVGVFVLFLGMPVLLLSISAVAWVAQTVWRGLRCITRLAR